MHPSIRCICNSALAASLLFSLLLLAVSHARTAPRRRLSTTPFYRKGFVSFFLPLVAAAPRSGRKELRERHPSISTTARGGRSGGGGGGSRRGDVRGRTTWGPERRWLRRSSSPGGGGCGGGGGGGREEARGVEELDPVRRGGGGAGAGRRQVRHHAPRRHQRARPAHPRPAALLPIHHPRPRARHRPQSRGSRPPIPPPDFIRDFRFDMRWDRGAPDS